VYRTLIELRGEIEGQRRLRSRDDILRLLSHAIGSHMDGWGDIIDALVVVLLPIEDRVTTKKRRGTPLEPGRTGPAEGLNRRQTISFFLWQTVKIGQVVGVLAIRSTFFNLLTVFVEISFPVAKRKSFFNSRETLP
jgi:hypothetical protein